MVIKSMENTKTKLDIKNQVTRANLNRYILTLKEKSDDRINIERMMFQLYVEMSDTIITSC